MPRLPLVVILFTLLPGPNSFLTADSRFEGMPVRHLQLQPDGPLQTASLPDLRRLVELQEGSPYSSSKVAHSIARLYATQLFYDIQVDVTAGPEGGVDVTFLLIRRFVVEEIRFTGRVRLDQRLLRRELTFREGEAFSQTGLEETQARLLELYVRHGYYQARILPHFKLERERPRLKLILEIQAGEQARVRSFEVQVREPLLRDEVLRRLRVRPGERYSKVRLEEELSSLQRYLELQGYLSPRIDLLEEHYDPSSNGLFLKLLVAGGERTEIRFEGVDPEKERLEQLPLFTQGAAREVFLEETRQELLLHYQRQGYFRCRVEYEIRRPPQQPVQVLLRVDKGSRYRLQAIRFVGNRTFPEQRLRRLLNVKEAGLFGNGLFTDERAQGDVRRLESFYQQQGFLDSQIEYSLRDLEGRPGALELIFEIQEGERYRVAEVEVVGNRQISTERLLREIESRPGRPFAPLSVAQDRATIIALYEDEGFRGVDFQSQVHYLPDHQVRLTYLIQEGERSYVEQVIVTGNYRTRSSAIRKELTLREGAPLSLGRMLQTETNLHNLLVFSRVQLQEIPSYQDSRRKTVLVQLEEAPRYTLLYGIGYSSFEGPRGTFGISDNNFLGMARTLSFGLRVGSKRQRGTLSYNLPRIFERKLPTLFSLTADNEEASTRTVRGTRTIRGRPFDAFRLIASSQTERILSRRESFFFGFRFENVRLDVPPDLAVPLQFFREEEKLRLSGLSFSYLNESRDQPLNPSSGFFLSGESRLFTSLLGSDEQFFRFSGQGQYYRPLQGGMVLATSLRLGVIAPFGKSAERPRDNPVPISERFFSGGATTLRGLPQDLAGPLLRDPKTGKVVLVNDRGEPDPNGRPVPLGGNALLIANVELRFPIFRFLAGTVFYDVGNVFRSLTTLSSAGFSNALGFGLQLRTPVGPVRFDVGYNPNPPDVPGFKNWNFHFTIGHPF